MIAPGSQNASYTLHKQVIGRFVRFLLSGVFNTATTYGLYPVLLRFVLYRTSYSLAYIIGVVLSYFLNRVFVFRSNRGLSTAALFPVVYLIQYLAGLSVVPLWKGSVSEIAKTSLIDFSLACSIGNF